jgi:wobble nucleotide-excising tRNase
MSDQIKKIDSIKKMAVFQNFRWNSSVRDEGNNVAEFKKLNIFYGRNYSGKTTLSRIFRAMETGSISEKYVSPEFQLSLESGKNVTQRSLAGHGQVVRVFNEDFVKENLRFVVDDEHTINSFAVLGEDNTKLEEKITQYEEELGSEETGTGLIGKMNQAHEAYRAAKKQYEDTLESLENKLRNKAINQQTGIKYNRILGDPSYNVTKIKNDIGAVCTDSYKPISSEEIEKYSKLLEENPKSTISEPSSINLNYTTLYAKTQELVEKKIQASAPIQELLNNAALEMWVRNGREHHMAKRTKCAFCGNDLPKNIWDRLDKHFNKESESLRFEIEALIDSIECEKSRIPNLVEIQKTNFYSSFYNDLEKLKERYELFSALYIKTLDGLKVQLVNRKHDIFSSLKFIESKFVEDEYLHIREKYKELCDQSNCYTTVLNSEQTKARKYLRLNEVYIFINDIKYSEECETIGRLRDALENTEEKHEKAREAATKRRAEIDSLMAQLKDESKGADRVNHYLNNFFGHQSLSLKAIDNAEGDSTCRFEVTRNNQKAFHLSEGECSLIAFCYFMAKLGDVETKGSQPIVWIDDPISSLDTNHIFFVYSLINAEIVTPEKYEENGEQQERERFKQLFISTHNLDFLKYIKRLPGALSKKNSQYFIVNRSGQSSDIVLMPRYLKDYVTEFNFLFHQIYKCAHANIECEDNHDCYYNFGNNARKFLEAFLYYKYPNQVENDVKLLRFFGDDILATALTARINHEYSHLSGSVERSVLPIEVPEMKSTARFILKKMKEKDPDQYDALLQSIGVNVGVTL